MTIVTYIKRIILIEKIQYDMLMLYVQVHTMEQISMETVVVYRKRIFCYEIYKKMLCKLTQSKNRWMFPIRIKKMGDPLAQAHASFP